MSKTAFAQLIISKMKAAIGTDGGKYSSATTSAAQAAIGQAITEYLIANTTLTISYNGMTTSTPPTPDIIAADTMKIAGACATPSTPSSYSSWIRELQKNIARGFYPQSPSTSLVTVMFFPFNSTSNSLSIPQDNLQSAHQNNYNDPQLVVWEVICEKLMDWINSASGMNPAAKAIAATRPGSAGTVTLTKITIT